MCCGAVRRGVQRVVVQLGGVCSVLWCSYEGCVVCCGAVRRCAVCCGAVRRCAVCCGAVRRCAVCCGAVVVLKSVLRYGAGMRCLVCGECLACLAHSTAMSPPGVVYIA